MRGGVYKPRSSPYAFRGLGDGLKMMHEQCKPHNIKIITESDASLTNRRNDKLC